MQFFHYSPNVVSVLDYFEANDTTYIVMEFIECQTFAQVLDRMLNKKLTLQDILSNLKPITTFWKEFTTRRIITIKGFNIQG